MTTETTNLIRLREHRIECPDCDGRGEWTSRSYDRDTGCGHRTDESCEACDGYGERDCTDTDCDCTASCQSCCSRHVRLDTRDLAIVCIDCGDLTPITACEVMCAGGSVRSMGWSHLDRREVCARLATIASHRIPTTEEHRAALRELRMAGGAK